MVTVDRRPSPAEMVLAAAFEQARSADPDPERLRAEAASKHPDPWGVLAAARAWARDDLLERPSLEGVVAVGLLDGAMSL